MESRGALTACDDCGHECRNGCVFLRADEQPYFQAYRVAMREPGHLRAGFEYIIWIGGRWREWRRLRGLAEYQSVTEEQRADFGEWLRGSVDFPEAA